MALPSRRIDNSLFRPVRLAVALSLLGAALPASAAPCPQAEAVARGDDHREPPALRPLERLGLYLRALRTEAFRNALGGAPGQVAPEPSAPDLRAFAEQLDTRPMTDVWLRFERLFLERLGAELESGVATADVARSVDHGPQIRSALDGAWSAYRGSAEGRPNAAGFWSYLESTDARREVLGYLIGLRALFAELQSSGIAPFAVRYCMQAVLAPITPETLSPAQMSRIVMQPPDQPAG
ncbi:MAG: hypothetical protein ACYTGC_02230 [Planctomycetota bacterium]|jgi:hypothetical protein